MIIILTKTDDPVVQTKLGVGVGKHIITADRAVNGLKTQVALRSSKNPMGMLGIGDVWSYAMLEPVLAAAGVLHQKKTMIPSRKVATKKSRKRDRSHVSKQIVSDLEPDIPLEIAPEHQRDGVHICIHTHTKEIIFLPYRNIWRKIK